MLSQNQMVMVVIGILCTGCFLWALIRQPGYSFFMLVRGFFFVLLLYAIQLCGSRLGWEHVVTVNVVTALISGLLGVPGIILLYGLTVFL